MTIDFKYSLGQKVNILAINMVGTIDSLVMDNQGPMYRVVYWNDSQRKAEFLYAWEISTHNP